MAAGKKTKATKPRDESDQPLTAAEKRQLERRIKDADDPRRFLLVATTLPWFSLYYEIQSDAWLLDDPTRATLFKRRAVARAVSDELGPGVAVVPCTVDGKGRLVLTSIVGRKVGRLRLKVLPDWKRKKTRG